MKTLKFLSGALAALIMLQQNYCEASTFVQGLRQNPAIEKSLGLFEIYDASKSRNIYELTRQATINVFEKVIAKMGNDAFEGADLKEKYFDEAKGIYSQYFAENMIKFVKAVFNDAIWNNNGGGMVALLNSEGRLEVDYCEKKLHKQNEFDKLVSDISNVLEPALYEYMKLSFHPDFDSTVLD